MRATDVYAGAGTWVGPRSMLMRTLLLFAALLLVQPASGVLVDSGEPNDTAPSDDPGFDNVGQGQHNAVYVGYGWVLTAAHVATTQGTSITLDGVPYAVQAASRVVFEHNPMVEADLAAVRLDPHPLHLPVLEIASQAPALERPVVMVGRGRDADGPASWGPGGWNWGGMGPMRWGSNALGGYIVGLSGKILSLPKTSNGRTTESLVVEFNSGGATPDESAVTTGDSGGALFAQNGSSWELIGIAWARSTFTNQPDETSIYGNDGFYVDLNRYRDQVLAVVRPCSDGVDNDEDGGTDAGDPGCLWAGDMSELSACSDGLDNDFDGSVDLADADCATPDGVAEGTDVDADGVLDALDNCLLAPNPDQFDSNGDGYGNLCDPDLTNDGFVGVPDFFAWVPFNGRSEGDLGYSADADITGDGVAGVPDWTLLFEWNGLPAGPSGPCASGGCN